MMKKEKEVEWVDVSFALSPPASQLNLCKPCVLVLCEGTPGTFGLSLSPLSVLCSLRMQATLPVECVVCNEKAEKGCGSNFHSVLGLILSPLPTHIHIYK